MWNFPKPLLRSRRRPILNQKHQKLSITVCNGLLNVVGNIIPFVGSPFFYTHFWKICANFTSGAIFFKKLQKPSNTVRDSLLEVVGTIPSSVRSTFILYGFLRKWRWLHTNHSFKYVINKKRQVKEKSICNKKV